MGYVSVNIYIYLYILSCVLCRYNILLLLLPRTRRDAFFCVHILLLLLYVRAASVVDDGAQHNRTRGCRVVDVCGFVAGMRDGCKVEMKEIDGNSIPAAIYYYRFMSDVCTEYYSCNI